MYAQPCRDRRARAHGRARDRASGTVQPRRGEGLRGRLRGRHRRRSGDRNEPDHGIRDRAVGPCRGVVDPQRRGRTATRPSGTDRSSRTSRRTATSLPRSPRRRAACRSTTMGADGPTSVGGTRSSASSRTGTRTCAPCASTRRTRRRRRSSSASGSRVRQAARIEGSPRGAGRRRHRGAWRPATAPFRVLSGCCELETIDGLPDEKVRRLHGLAEAALDGRLHTERLRSLPTGRGARPAPGCSAASASSPPRGSCCVAAGSWTSCPATRSATTCSLRCTRTTSRGT